MTDIAIDDLRALTHLSDTGLLTLFGRALESRSGGVLEDPGAEALAAALAPVLAASDRPLHQRLARGDVARMLGVYTGLRARYFDDQALEFLSRRSGAVIVNMGCGLDGRSDRLRRRVDDEAALEVVDVDLPAVIAVRARVMPPGPGVRQIAADVTDLAWLDALPGDRPLVFLAEGLLMYLDPAAVRRLVLAIRGRFPGSELVAEVFRRRWLEGWRGRLLRRKLRGRFDMDASAGFHFGVADAAELAGWADGIVVLSEWSFLDESTPRLRGLRWMRRFDGLRRLQWVVRWRLGGGVPAATRGGASGRGQAIDVEGLGRNRGEPDLGGAAARSGLGYARRNGPTHRARPHGRGDRGGVRAGPRLCAGADRLAERRRVLAGAGGDP